MRPGTGPAETKDLMDVGVSFLLGLVIDMVTTTWKMDMEIRAWGDFEHGMRSMDVKRDEEFLLRSTV